jgi:hypothetical protein
MESSVCCPSPPNTYSYVQEEHSGSTRKFVDFFMFCVLPTKFMHLTGRAWAGDMAHECVDQKLLKSNVFRVLFVVPKL